MKVLDPNTEVDQSGKIVNSIEVAYRLGFNAKSFDDNPYIIDSNEWISFNGGFKDYLIEYFANEFNL